MNERLLGNHYELTSVPVDFTDAVDEWVCELPLEEQHYVNDDEISLRDIVRGLRQSSPEGIMFASTSFESSAYLLRIKNKEKDITIQQAWDLSIDIENCFVS